MITKYHHSRCVRFAETDASGFAYLDTYIRMMEETEYAFLRSRGLRVVLLDDKGTLGFPRLYISIDVKQPLCFEQLASIELSLKSIDGKQIVYEFSIRYEEDFVASGIFKVACCRFPENESPYAILTPEFVINKLTETQYDNPNDN